MHNSSVSGKNIVLSILISLFLTLSGCSSSDDNAKELFQGPSECSTIGQNRFVFDVIDQWYLWNDSLPNIDPDNYSSPESLLDALTANAPVVDRFSYIADQATSDAFFNAGEFTGLGFTSKNINNHLILALVFSGSPAAQAGLARGYEIVSVDGVDVVSTLTAGNSVDFGANETGVLVDIEYKDLDGIITRTNVTKNTVNIDTVPASGVIDNNGISTGYLHFYTFIEPSNAALDAAFSEFETAGVEELIVDVRYNGGGLITVANYLAGLIGGTTTVDQVLSKRLHNADRAAAEDETTYFSDQVHALDLSRVVFITAGGSASASELVINALSPFLDVVLVGDTTFGKPVGQYGFDFCDSTLFPVAFETVNADNEGEYFDGLAVDCPANDDLSTALGDTTEASLAEALTYLDTGSCSVAAINATSTNKAINTKPSVEIIKSWKVFDAN